MDNKRTLRLYAPEGLAITPVADATLLEYKNLRCQQGLPWAEEEGAVGKYPWKGIGSMSVKDFSSAELNLMLLYIEAAKQFDDSATLPEAFIKAYKRIFHPAFLRYLKFFAFEFTEALTANDLEKA